MRPKETGFDRLVPEALTDFIGFGRGPGAKLAVLGLAIGVLGWFPLVLYVIFGPADGNPIGLGLLAWAATAVAVPMVAAGALRRLVEVIRGR